MGKWELPCQEPAELVGKKQALSFAPATDANVETIANYLPQQDENGNIDAVDIPELLSKMGYWQPGAAGKPPLTVRFC
ncbi:MAG: hypothetical protein K6L60_11795 [Oceanobacter sp.]